MCSMIMWIRDRVHVFPLCLPTFFLNFQHLATTGNIPSPPHIYREDIHPLMLSHSSLQDSSPSIENDTGIKDEVDQYKKTKKGILASLRYLNSQDLIFNNVDAYFITANVVKVLDSKSAAKDLPNIALPELSNEDYSLVGDIVSMSIS
ncbi:uncharacterized protein LACBIDRAFT_327835 [Laccaria bicolor S238N-H82]|uniref:Predicted protein n=1 Tax=Laccaria bicolor (strain S238N-H82 / ATCC MYA-4686) TaxID=486041 RepID=B0DCZ5_LACBS|nr:uncharacterized protein LACBIDRAFT_327835 [Laccaria bicolor S238N-H82]EDR07524.1 predicted protein [Laccaria bicolor S238N-H82]|eukprot:XP_001881916.1 predicted protein [Laccaria bicolor S238N-H82]